MTEQQFSTTDIELARTLAASDFKTFLHVSTNLIGHVPPKFHLVMADFLQGARDEWVARTKTILGYRLAAKSFLARQLILWRWLRCPWAQVIVHCSTDEMATKFTKAILAELRSNPLMEHLAPTGNVSETQFNLAGIGHEVGYSIQSAGIRTSLTGSRCDLYFFDDPEPDIDPESMRHRIVGAFEEASHILQPPDRHLRKMGLTEVPRPELTQLVVVGQPHCINSAYIPTEDESSGDPEAGGGHPLMNGLTMRVPVVNRTGEWTWPEMMARKYNVPEEGGRPMTVEEVRRGFTSLNWHLQMMIDPDAVKMLGAVLRIKHIEVTRRRLDYAIMVVDPADGGNCEHGLAIGGICGSHIHVLYMGGMTGDAYEGDQFDGSVGESVWRRIFDLAAEFRVGQIYLEKNLKSAATACRRYLHKTGHRAVVNEYVARTNKLRRICSYLEQPINNGMVTAEPDVLRDPKNLRQLRGLRFGSLPEPCDRIDALAALFQQLVENPALAAHRNQQEVRRNQFYRAPSMPAFNRLGAGAASPFERMRA